MSVDPAPVPSQPISKKSASLESALRTALQTGIGQAVLLAIAGFILAQGTDGIGAGEWWYALGSVVLAAVAAAVQRLLQPISTDAPGKHVAGTPEAPTP